MRKYCTAYDSNLRWPQYVNPSDRRAYCSYMHCRRPYGQPLPDVDDFKCGNRHFFCELGECYRGFYERTAAGALRSTCWERDKGVCQNCKRDTEDLVQAIQHMLAEERKQKLLESFNNVSASRIAELCKPQQLKKGRRSKFWEADHVTPVALGGGETGADNIRTLCLNCHA